MHRLRTDDGFTLIELLVVILIIGILATLALPAFLRQQAKGQDAKAKTDARHLVSYMETCFVEQQSFVGCGTSLGANYQGIVMGTGVGQTSISDETTNGYKVVATSKAGASHTFTIDHTLGSTFDRSCGAPGEGGCDANGDW